MSELLDRCRAYGADVDATMERLVNDEELFEMCLAQFSEDAGFAELRTAIEAKDYHAAFEHAHALKGVAGNLGLTPLFEAISVLVEALRVDDYSHVEAQYQAILDEQGRVNRLLEG
ncbi:MAG: Hpt domain-containing protein [Hespellia sp.]|nr:Hpt domain-containing protein [Hespellia sp.]